MVLFLVVDVLGHCLHLRRAQRKAAITILPVEGPQGGTLGVGPFGGTRFDGFNHIRQGVVLRHPKEDVNVIAHAPNFLGRRVEILEDRCQVGMNPFAKRSQEQRFAVLGAEYEVDIQL
jgi:hypothetical protein